MQLVGIGIDTVEISRIAKSVAHKRFLERVYSAEELALFSSKRAPIPSMAGNWAAKEAFSKALGTGVDGFLLSEISVLRNALGAPELVLTGAAKRLAAGLTFQVSITHTRSYASAVVIALLEQGGCYSLK
ncbi:MAG: holo-ACP synthase [Oscillospiraceae bacterium]